MKDMTKEKFDEIISLLGDYAKENKGTELADAVTILLQTLCYTSDVCDTLVSQLDFLKAFIIDKNLANSLKVYEKQKTQEH